MARRRGAMSRPRRGDDGLTLVELLVTVSILSVAGLAVIGALFTMTVSSSTSREQTRAMSYARRYAELAKAQQFVPAAGDSTYLPGITASATGFPPPAGWQAPVLVVACWDGSTFQDLGGLPGATCPAATSVQRVTVTETSTSGGYSATLQVVKAQW